LGFTNEQGGLDLVQPDTLAQILGAYAPFKGGNLELVFLNGCSSHALGEAVHEAGIPNVVCWETSCNDEAAQIFSTAFYKHLQEHGKGYAQAFDHAKHAVLTETEGRSDGMSTPKYAFADPAAHIENGRMQRTASGAWPAGTPVFFPKAPAAAQPADPQVQEGSASCTPLNSSSSSGGGGSIAAAVPYQQLAELVSLHRSCSNKDKLKRAIHASLGSPKKGCTLKAIECWIKKNCEKRTAGATVEWLLTADTEKARNEAVEKPKQESEEKAKKEAEEKAKEAEKKAKKEADENQRKEAAAKAAKKAMKKAAKEAKEQAAKEAKKRAA
jgi:hypothetical protein